MRFSLILALIISQAWAYERSWHYLTTGNGHGFQIFDGREGRIKEFLEHPYRFVAPPDNRRDGGIGRRNLAHDIYFGARADGQHLWLERLSASYEQQSNIITARKREGEMSYQIYYFSPFGYEGNAMVMLIRAENIGGSSKSVSLFAKPNLKLGSSLNDSRVGRGDESEEISWNGTYGIETGPGGGHVIYMPIGGVEQAGCGADADLYRAIQQGEDAQGGPNCQGDSQILILQKNLEIPAGESRWWGEAILFLNDNPNEPQREDFRDHRSLEQILALWEGFAGDAGAEELHHRALSEFEAWRVPTMLDNLSNTEKALWRQSETVLRMGQVREPKQPNRRNFGMVLAALPVGEWHTGWVRDMAYAVVAMSMTGHPQEAQLGIEFWLNAEASYFSGGDYIGFPYRISSCRYYGNGKEEADFNYHGPNVETDGWGLVLWAARMSLHFSCDFAWLESRTDYGDTVLEGLDEVAQNILDNMDNDLPRAEASIWEVHWDFRQVFTYTAAAQIRGLYDYADILEAYAARRPEQGTRWSQRAAECRDAASRMHQALRDRLVHRQDQSLVSHLGVAQSHIYRDGSTGEALSWSLFLPEDPVFRSTLNQFTSMQTGFGGYRRLEADLSLVGEASANLYDLSEWVLLDLRIGEAWRRLGETARADELLNKITDTAAVNDFLIPELFDPDQGYYTGVVPMVGYGAGAWMMAQMEKYGFRPPLFGNQMEHCPMGPPDPPLPVDDGGIGDGGRGGSGGGGGAINPWGDAGTGGPWGDGSTGAGGSAGGGPGQPSEANWDDDSASMCSAQGVGRGGGGLFLLLLPLFFGSMRRSREEL